MVEVDENGFGGAIYGRSNGRVGSARTRSRLESPSGVDTRTVSVHSFVCTPLRVLRRQRRNRANRRDSL